jgi:hypothetical protein
MIHTGMRANSMIGITKTVAKALQLIKAGSYRALRDGSLG